MSGTATPNAVSADAATTGATMPTGISDSTAARIIACTT